MTEHSEIYSIVIDALPALQPQAAATRRCSTQADLVQMHDVGLLGTERGRDVTEHSLLGNVCFCFLLLLLYFVHVFVVVADPPPTHPLTHPPHPPLLLLWETQLLNEDPGPIWYPDPTWDPCSKWNPGLELRSVIPNLCLNPNGIRASFGGRHLK